MVDLRPWRVPVAVILLIAMAVRVGVSLAGIVGAAAGNSGMVTALAGGSVGAGEIFLCVALAAVCWWCTDEGVRGARGLAITALVLVSAQILLSVVATLAMVPLMAGVDTQVVTILIQLIWLVVPILAAAVLLRCARASSASRRSLDSPPAELPAGEPEDAPPGDAEEAESAYAEPASWAPDEAAGAAWTSAGEAAKGGSAAGWGSGSGTNWEPADWSGASKPALGAGDPTPPEQSQTNHA